MSGDRECSTSWLPSAVYRTLVGSASLRSRRGIGRVWQRGWDRACARWEGPVAVRIHGRHCVVNFGYLYPVYARQYPTYNAPLVDAVTAAASRASRPAVVVDVGAAVGDTALLLKERCGAALGGVICVDGDEEFLRYLRCNLGGDSMIEIHAALLSRGEATTPSLVRTHRGTASAVGHGRSNAVTLDATLAESALAADGIDVLKIDVDGYDGAVLAGAVETLGRFHPSVLFEWHPILYDGAGNGIDEPFDVLAGAGYQDFSWFDRTGVHDGDMHDVDPAEVGRRAAVSRANPERDVHWDVLATRSPE